MLGPPRPARATAAAVLVVVALATGPALSTPSVAAPAAVVVAATAPTTEVDPAEVTADADRGLVELPDPTGELVAFRVTETTVLEPELAARHPELRTWAGTAVDGEQSLSLDVTPAGVHAAVLGGEASWYLDPTADGGHTSRTRAELPASELGLDEPQLSAALQRRVAENAAQAPSAAPVAVQTDGGASVSLRTYRLALLSDPSYAAAVAPNPTSNADSDARVLAAKTTLVNRINQVYGADLGIRFTLAAGTDTALNLWTPAEATAANGPCGAVACFSTTELASCTSATLTRERWVIGRLVGASAYDVGHLAIAQPGGLSVRGVGTAYKAGGCTGLSQPTGDPYAIDFLAHELGHQFGASHTFDGCGGNDVPSNAVEPGSGSTIMGYAGICGADDLQAHSDPVFSHASRDQIASYVVSGPWVDAEVQTVSLQDFDGTDSFRLTVGGQTTAPIVRGTTYTWQGLQTALTAIGVPVRWVGPYLSSASQTTIGSGGFTIVYAPGSGDVAQPTVQAVSGTFTAVVSEIDKGTNGTTLTAGGTVTVTGNHAPAVTAPAARSIPVRTPFQLTATGTDTDGDTVRYLWEQTDVADSGQRTLATQPKAAGPLFRVFGTGSDSFANAPGPSSTRSFPDLAQVLAGRTNAATGTCVGANRECLSEWLPTAAYGPSALHFRVTASDAAPTGGGVTSDGVTLTLDKTAGPLQVTSQAAPGTTLPAGSTQTVTWAVNGTDKVGLAPQVRLLLSTDGGQTFGTELLASTPNDGSATVTLPAWTVAAARLRVEAVGNYFYDVNDAAFAIQVDGAPLPLAVTTPWPDQVPVQYGDRPAATLSASSGFGEITASATGLPGVTLVKSVSGAVTTFSATAVAAAPGSYPVAVTVTDGVTSVPLTTTVVVAPEDVAVTYTGDTQVVSPAATTLRATFAEPADGSLASLGDVVATFTNGAGTSLCSTPVTSNLAGAGTASCAAALPAGTHQVTATASGTHSGVAAAATVSVITAPVPTPTPTPVPVVAPDTSITSGPTGWVASGASTVTVAASLAGARFDCRLDGAPVACPSGSATLTGLTSGTHRFTAAAVAADGGRDPSPAVRDFAVPVDDPGLTTAGRWRRRTSEAAYGGGCAETRRRGATLTYQVSGARELALMVRTGRGFGKIKVYLGEELLATVRTAGKRGQGKTVQLAAFAQPRSGQLRIVSASGRPVQVDGLGVSTAPF